VCDLETSRMGAPYIYDISRLRVNDPLLCEAITIHQLSPLSSVIIISSFW